MSGTGPSFLGKCEHAGCDEHPSVHQKKPFDAVLCGRHFPLADRALHADTEQ